MIPEVSTLRMRLLNWSPMKRLPAPSSATPLGPLKLALVAGLPSPLNLRVPLPATVVMIPEGSTLRMRWLARSAMKKLPLPSTATPLGKAKPALVAGAPSPLKPEMPLPATVVMMPEVSTLRMRLLFRSAMKRLPAPSTATPVGKAKLALVAGPPSPLNPEMPMPATTVNCPEVSTLKTRS